MSESGDYTPAPWTSGVSYKDARAAYISNAHTGLAAAVSAGVKASSLVPESLVSEAENPVVIAFDVTGSMGTWPATMFGKMGYFFNELREYLGEDSEVSFCAIGDGPKHDQYPLQVKPFARDKTALDHLNAMIREGGGGGGGEESYDLAALYYSKKCECPDAIRKPIFIFVGDEGVYETVDRVVAENVCHITLKSVVQSSSVFETLKEKFNVYIIRKPYGGTEENPSADEVHIRDQWRKLLGADHVLSLADPERVVDVIYGILAKESGKDDYFLKELKERQLKDDGGDVKVAVVLKSLHTIHSKKGSVKKLPPPARAKSITRRDKKKPPSTGLGGMVDLGDD